MALTKVSRGLLTTSIVDNGNDTAITIDSSENVGIGTSPAYKLDVASAVIQFGDSTDAFAQYKSSAGNWHVGANSSNAFAFYSGTYGAGTERLRIDSAGNVGIGSVPDSWSALTSLDISQSASFAGHDSQNAAYFMNNLYFNGSAWTAKNTGTSSGIVLDNITGHIAFYLNASASADAGVSLVERMRIDSSGNLGLGGNPIGAARLVVSKSSGGDVVIFTDTTTADLIVNCTSGVTRVSPSTGTLALGTGNVEKLRIDSSGNLLVGTTSPLLNSKANFVRSNTSSSAIVINAYNSAATSTSRATNSIFRGASQGNGADVHLVLTDSVANNYYFGGNQAGTWVATNTNGVRLSNGGTSWASDSDERLKDIIEPIENGLEKVLTLRSVIGKYKTDEEDKRRVFLIAQDVQAVLPEAVFENEGNLMLQYTDLIPLCIKAIQEQQATITALTARLTALENN